MMQIRHSVVLNVVQGSGHENEDSLTALGKGGGGGGGRKGVVGFSMGIGEPLKVSP